MQFRFLERLLLVYGRLNNRRISTLINYIFYKTTIVSWAVLMFGLCATSLSAPPCSHWSCCSFSAFSGQFILLDWAFQLHNVAYTAFPILVYAVVDRDIEPSTLHEFPQIYTLTWEHCSCRFP